MRLEGSLDAFSLPDILQLLAFTQKTGALVLHRPDAQGVVRVRGGAVSGASADTKRQALGRRLVGAGLVDDEDLAAAVAAVRAAPDMGLGRALVDTGAVSEDTLKRVAGEQAADAVSELLRWTEGTFEFVLDAPDPDGVTLALPVETVLAEGKARLDQWPAFATQIPSAGTVLALTMSPAGEPSCARDEWVLLALVDGRRTVADIIELAGWGEFAVVRSLAGLTERGLLVRTDEGDGGLGALLRRQDLVRSLETAAIVPAAPAPELQPAEPGREPTEIVPEGDDPYGAAAEGPAQGSLDGPEDTSAFGALIAESYPSVAGHVPQQAAVNSMSTSGGQWSAPTMGSSFAEVARAVVGATSGSAAMAPAEMPDPVPVLAHDRDSAVTKSLLLRLIAGVRGL